MEFKEDLRIQKTRRDLRAAIIELIKEKPIEKVSVTEICEKAMVNRMTFYKYYEDKFSLLDDTVNEIKDSIEAKVPTTEIKSLEEASIFFAKIIKVVIEFIDNNKDLIYAVQKNGDYKLLDIITYISESAINDVLSEVNKVKPLKYSIPVTSSFIYGGFLSTVAYWVDHPDAIDRNQLIQLNEDIRNNLFAFDFLFK